MEDLEVISNLECRVQKREPAELIQCDWFDYKSTLANSIANGGGYFRIRGVEERKPRPEIAAVYLMTWGGIPLYVGQTTNLRKRWSGHRMTRECKYLVHISIIFTPVRVADPCDLLRAEFATICRCRPVLQRRLPDDRRAIREFIREVVNARNESEGYVVYAGRRHVETSHSLVEVPNG